MICLAVRELVVGKLVYALVVTLGVSSILYQGLGMHMMLVDYL